MGPSLEKPDSSYETLLRQLKASAHTSNKPSPKNVSFDMPTTSTYGIPGVGDSPLPIPPAAAVVSAPEIMSAPDPASWHTYEMYLKQQNSFKHSLRRFGLEEQFGVWWSQQQCDPP